MDSSVSSNLRFTYNHPLVYAGEHMRVRVNGKDEDVEVGMTVAALVARYKLEPRHVAIEVNCDLVPRRSFDATALKEGDQIEIVTLVGGG